MGRGIVKKRVVINADDFGFCEGVTDGIIRAHLDGIVTSTTLTANMPNAAAAVEKLKGLGNLGVGVHLNVTQGPVLSKPGRKLTGDDGIMNHSATSIISACVKKPSLLRAVHAECDAQIKWMLDHGIKPTHIDSHRHSHAYWPIFTRVIHLAKRYDIRIIRRHHEFISARVDGEILAKQKNVRRILNIFGAVNEIIAPEIFFSRGTWGIAKTGLLDADWLIRVAAAVKNGITEIMTHPGLPAGLDAKQTRLIETRRQELDALCSKRVKQAFEENEIELTHYGAIAKLLNSV